MEETTIKQNIVHYRGEGKPFIPTAYGYLKLTEEKLILEYYLFGIPIVDKVCGLGIRRLEIPIKNIATVSNKPWLGSGILKISYILQSGTKEIYVSPWKAFTSLGLIEVCNDWIEAINRLKSG
jgi:hypothetical protein